MGVLLHQDAVVVSAGLGLVRVDTEIDRPRVILREERPLHAAGESSTAAPAKSRSLHLIDHFRGLLFFQHALDGGIAAIGAVALQLAAVGLVDACQEYR